MLRCARASNIPRATVARAAHRSALRATAKRRYATAPNTAAASPGDSAVKAAGARPSEGAPFRYPLAWQDPDFYDEKKLEEESRRIFEVCHGCRRCFNLCNSFPRLFELIDKTPGGALEEVPSKTFKSVADDCTLCDMCFITKCPYTPPHEFNIDFPALMLRYRAVERGAPPNIKLKPLPDAPQKLPPFKYSPEPVAVNIDRSLELHSSSPSVISRVLQDMWTTTDFMGPVGSFTATLSNWITKRGAERFARKSLEYLLGISQKADLPTYVPRRKTLPFALEERNIEDVNPEGPSARKRKAFLFATCFVTFNKPDIGIDAVSVLRKNGVVVETEHLMCCGMPQLEAGDVQEVVHRARELAPELAAMVDDGIDIVSPVPSCTFMLKHQWPLLLPENEDVTKVAAHTFDLSEYIVDISKKEGLVQPLAPVVESVTLQHACHARAQNMGFKSKEMLSLIPGLQIHAIERCSGHGGSFGVKKGTHEIAVNVGKPVAQTVLRDHRKAKGEEPERSSVATAPRKPIFKTFGGHPVGPHGAAKHAPSPLASASGAAQAAPSAPSQAPSLNSTPLPSPSSSVQTSATPTAKPVPRQPPRPHTLSSDCPLAADHLAQIVRDSSSVEIPTVHPIQLLARAMGVGSSVQKAELKQ